MSGLTVDWRYHRNGCTTCKRAEDFLEAHKVEAKEVALTSKKTLGSAEALDLAASVEQIYATKGTKRVHFDMRKDKPSEADLLAVMLGPTGNLRAPMIKKGKTLLVGFDAESYEKVLTAK
jgi:arsenate reductase-like glutaredoxin family protein